MFALFIKLINMWPILIGVVVGVGLLIGLGKGEKIDYEIKLKPEDQKQLSQAEIE